MPPSSQRKPSALVPFVLGIAVLGFGIHLFTPDSSDTPELVLSGILIAVGVILLGRALRNLFYKPNELDIQVAERKATVPFIERRRHQIERRRQQTERRNTIDPRVWVNDRRRGPSGRREANYDRRTMPDRRKTTNRPETWDDPSVLRPVKPSQQWPAR